jgi:hypothetical protein
LTYDNLDTAKRSHPFKSRDRLVPIVQIGKLIMALKNTKPVAEPIAPPETERPGTQAIDLENAIAEELLNDIDWQKVRAALIKKAPARLFAWLVSGENTPVNISQFPELSAMPSSDDEGKAA